MAKSRFSAGAEIDFLSPDEFDRGLHRFRSDVMAYNAEREGTIRVFRAASFTTDANGNAVSGPYNGGYSIFQPPEGYLAYLVRVVVDTPQSLTVAEEGAADYVSATVFAYMNNVDPSNTIFGTGCGATTLPFTWEASRSHAPVVRQGERVVMCLTVLASVISSSTTPLTSTAVYPSVQVVLVPVKSQRQHDPV